LAFCAVGGARSAAQWVAVGAGIVHWPFGVGREPGAIPMLENTTARINTNSIRTAAVTAIARCAAISSTLLLVA